ncbi:hypothetical protein NEOC65_002081 [Neochlamydia sp. AcF65]|nr:hypothetical protein [Neochlamydia sp. AcF65]
MRGSLTCRFSQQNPAEFNSLLVLNPLPLLRLAAE